MNLSYTYKKKDIPADIVERAKELMPLIGCRTFTAFVSIGMTDFMNRLENENKKDTNK